MAKKIIDDGQGGELLEVTSPQNYTKESLVKQKAAIATWRSEENTRHATRIADLDAKETILDADIAMFKKVAQI